MIKLTSSGELIANLSVPGTQTAATDKVCFLVPFDCRLKAIYLALGTAGITGSQDVDIKKNGTSIISSANKIRFATTIATPTAASITFTTDPTTFAAGDVITLNVDAIHSGTAAKNLCVMLLLQRLKQSGPVATKIDGLE